MTSVFIVARSRFVKMSSLAAEGVNLAREYPQSVFLQIMHPRILHIKNSSDAKLAGIIEHFEKMACFHGNHC